MVLSFSLTFGKKADWHPQRDAIGALKDLFGSYGYGVLCFALVALAGEFLLLEFGIRWSSTWPPPRCGAPWSSVIEDRNQVAPRKLRPPANYSRLKNSLQAEMRARRKRE
jgi:hypothetical protein